MNPLPGSVSSGTWSAKDDTAPDLVESLIRFPSGSTSAAVTRSVASVAVESAELIAVFSAVTRPAIVPPCAPDAMVTGTDVPLTTIVNSIAVVVDPSRLVGALCRPSSW